MNFESYRDTKTIKINYSSEDPNEAATIANAIAKAYSDYRLVRWQQMTQTGIRTLEELYKEEENQIRVNQRSVDLLREKFKIDKEDEAESNLVLGFAKTITPTELEQLRKKFNEQRPFWDEKRKLRSLEEFHKALATKIEAEKSFFQIPKNPVVEFVDAAKPPEFPVGPNRWLGATMFAIGLLPTVGGILLLKSSCRSMLLL